MLELSAPVIAIVGPTASGKTDAAQIVAERLGGEVVSADSMQIYRGLSIASAKPTEEEMGGVPHHMFDICDTDEAFSVADYVSMAQREVQDISARGALPILCGGTGLYLDSFLRGEEALKNTGGDPQLRAALTEAKNAGKGIELDVDSENPTALNLYRSFGFAPTFEVEYWRVPVHDCL